MKLTCLIGLITNLSSSSLALCWSAPASLFENNPQMYVWEQLMMTTALQNNMSETASGLSRFLPHTPLVLTQGFWPSNIFT